MFKYLALLTAPERSEQSNLHLGASLAFIAGALNAGGFLAIGQYTSHMTGIVSAAADNLVEGNIVLMITAVFALFAFICGAASTAIMVNYAKRQGIIYFYSPTLIAEAILLLIFGLVGKKLQEHDLLQLSMTAILLCYVMGLQNALITKISHAQIRTTHLTGLVTDIGIELGKLIYWNRSTNSPPNSEVQVNQHKLMIYTVLLTCFFVGGILGAVGFKYVGFISSVPLAFALLILAIAPVFSAVENV